MSEPYRPEPYWSRVAREIRARGPGNVVAGDDTPYYRYKRARFLTRFLAALDVEGRAVLEVGCGPGGNLVPLLARRPRRLVGADISSDMLALAAETLGADAGRVELIKTDGKSLPFPDRAMDLTLTSTVLQHNLEEADFQALVEEICRVTAERVVLVEDTEPSVLVGESAVRRPISHYQAACARRGFEMISARFLRTPATYFAHRAVNKAWKTLFGYRFSEGERVPAGLATLLSVAVATARPLDDLLPERSGLTKMEFVRRSGLPIPAPPA